MSRHPTVASSWIVIRITTTYGFWVVDRAMASSTGRQSARWWRAWFCGTARLLPFGAWIGSKEIQNKGSQGNTEENLCEALFSLCHGLLNLNYVCGSVRFDLADAVNYFAREFIH